MRSELFIFFDQLYPCLFEQMESGFVDIFENWPQNSAFFYAALKDKFCRDGSRHTYSDCHGTETLFISDLDERTLAQISFSIDFNDETMLHCHEVCLPRLQTQLWLN